MNKKNGLALTMVFQASSLNYNDDPRELKKFTRGDGQQYSYASRNAIRYNIVNDFDEKDKAKVVINNTVAQFAPDETIENAAEIDLFGYMKTGKSSKGKKNEEAASDDNAGGATIKRVGAVRLMDAKSLEPMRNDIAFTTNAELARRAGAVNPTALMSNEIHTSFYEYTVCIDLDRIGIDGDIEIPNAEKAARINMLLDKILLLYRDIRGRRENLSPMFAIGGLYETKNPVFSGRVRLVEGELDVDMLNATKEYSDDFEKNTYVGYMKGTFKNDDEIESKLEPISVPAMFKKMKEEVNAYYECN